MRTVVCVHSLSQEHVSLSSKSHFLPYRLCFPDLLAVCWMRSALRPFLGIFLFIGNIHDEVFNMHQLYSNSPDDDI